LGGGLARRAPNLYESNSLSARLPVRSPALRDEGRDDTDVTDSSVGDAYMRPLIGINVPAPSEKTEPTSHVRVICVFRSAEPVPKNRNDRGHTSTIDSGTMGT